MSLGVNSASNRNELFPGGKFGRCVGLTTSSLSYADCPEIWEPHPLWTLRACTGIALLLLTNRRWKILPRISLVKIIYIVRSDDVGCIAVTTECLPN